MRLPIKPRSSALAPQPSLCMCVAPHLRVLASLQVPPQTWKKTIAGKGNADKEAMIAAARARGFSPADDNEADAIAILFWALETKGGLQ